MASITLRNIPDSVLASARRLAELDRRSLNNELVVILERGLAGIDTEAHPRISRCLQEALWSDIAGKWEDDRSTQEIVEDIYEARSPGRDVDL